MYPTDDLPYCERCGGKRIVPAFQGYKPCPCTFKERETMAVDPMDTGPVTLQRALVIDLCQLIDNLLRIRGTESTPWELDVQERFLAARLGFQTVEDWRRWRDDPENSLQIRR